MGPACHPTVRTALQTDRVTWAAVILTGGTAARLDGADKASLEHAGRSLLERALDAVAGAARGRRGRTGGADVARPVTFTRETPPGGGPLAGPPPASRRSPGSRDLVVVLAVDMPHVTAGTVARLLARGRATWTAPGSIDRHGPAPAGRRRPAVARSRRPSDAHDAYRCGG